MIDHTQTTPTIQYLLDRYEAVSCRAIHETFSWYQETMEELRSDWGDGTQPHVRYPNMETGEIDILPIPLPPWTPEQIALNRFILECIYFVTAYFEHVRFVDYDLNDSPPENSETYYNGTEIKIALSLVRNFDAWMAEIDYDFEWLHKIEADNDKENEALDKMTTEQQNEHMLGKMEFTSKALADGRIPGELESVE